MNLRTTFQKPKVETTSTRVADDRTLAAVPPEVVGSETAVVDMVTGVAAAVVAHAAEAVAEVVAVAVAIGADAAAVAVAVADVAAVHKAAAVAAVAVDVTKPRDMPSETGCPKLGVSITGS